MSNSTITSANGATTNLVPLDIELGRLHADVEFNCRGEFKPNDVIDLARTMKEQGLLQPITVRPYDEKRRAETGYDYGIVAGYRRHMAARVLGWPTIPCIVREGLSDVDARLLNLGENLQRKELNILQEAKALLNLKCAGLKQEDVAIRLNQSRGWVQVRFYLLEFPPEIQQEAAAGLLTQQQIRELYTMPSNRMRIEAVKRIKDAKINGEKIPKIKAKKLSTMAKKVRDRGEIFALMDHIQENIGNNIGTRALAWAAGEISDNDIFREILAIATEQGKPYRMPIESLTPSEA